MPPNRVNLIGVYDNYNFSVPIEYTFALIFSIYGVSYRIVPFHQFSPEDYDSDETVVISYGREHMEISGKKQVHIYASDFFGSKNYLGAQSMPQTPLGRYGDLPVIYSGSGKLNGWVKASRNSFETNIDVIASSFFMVSRYEEVVIDTRDPNNRFSAKTSLAYKEGFLGRPIVSEYVELLWKWSHSLEPNLERKAFWTENKDFAVCLTHDVDSLKKYSTIRPPVLDIGRAILKRRNLQMALNIAEDYLGSLLHYKRDPFDTFDYMLNLEKRCGFKSSFYFMACGASKFDGDYSITEPGVIKLIQSIESQGCEVGLHASYNTYDNLEAMTSEKYRLDRLVSNKSYGCRQHGLRWKTPDTWRIQEKLGLLYDTSLSFADHIGFRCGICFPFRPFDVAENRMLNIWELPLIVMEGSLQHPNYQNLSPQQAYQEITKLIRVVRKYSGVFVLLWHNSSFDPLEWAGWKEIYERVMNHLAGQNAFVASGRKIIAEWKRRLSCRL